MRPTGCDASPPIAPLRRTRRSLDQLAQRVLERVRWARTAQVVVMNTAVKTVRMSQYVATS